MNCGQGDSPMLFLSGFHWDYWNLMERLALGYSKITKVLHVGLRSIPHRSSFSWSYTRIRLQQWRNINNLTTFNPFPIPFRRFSCLRRLYHFQVLWAVEHFFSKVERDNLTVWFQNFTDPWLLANLAVKRKIYLNFDVDWLSDVPPHQEQNPCLANADLIFTVGVGVYQKRKSIYPHKTFLIPQCVDFESFDSIRSSTHLREPKDLERIPAPRGISLSWINSRLDFDLIYHVAEVLPNISFVFLGEFVDFRIRQTVKKKMKQRRIKNLFFLGLKSRFEIPNYLFQGDFFLIPYRTDLWINRYCNPLKLYEYFAVGKPVVSTALSELSPFSGLISLANNTFEFIEAVKNIVAGSKADHLHDARIEVSRSHSIEEAVNQTRSIIDTHLWKV